jgi:hypothetical protein
MIKYYIFPIFCLCCSLLSAQPDEWFDPDRDPIMRTINGKLRIVESEDIIVRASNIRIGGLHSTVETFEKREMYNHWYIVFECRFSPDRDQSAKVYLQLRDDGTGNYFADTTWIACVGRPCGSCELNPDTEYCVCKTERPDQPGELGECNQVWSTEALLFRIRRKPD